VVFTDVAGIEFFVDIFGNVLEEVLGVNFIA
jgi:hypothetical protein